MAAYDVTTSAASIANSNRVTGWSNSVKIDDGHYVYIYSGPSDDGYAQVFAVNTSTYEVSTASASFVFSADGYGPNGVKIGDNHILTFAMGPSGDGFANVLVVNTSTWVVSTASSSLEFDTLYGVYHDACLMDANHAINFWYGGSGNHSWAQVFTVNTTTWAVTTANASLDFQAGIMQTASSFKIDSTHAILFYSGIDTDGFAQVFAINTTTWAITTASTALEFDTNNCICNSCYQIDANHFINFWSGPSNHGFAQVFVVNTSTWAVTTAAAALEFDTSFFYSNSCYKVDTNHFIDFYGGSASDGYAQVFTVNTTTWQITTTTASLEFDTQYGAYSACQQVDTNHFINMYGGGASQYATAQVFTVELPSGSTDYPVAVTEALAMVSSDTQVQALLSTIINNLVLSETQTDNSQFNQSATDNLSLSDTNTNQINRGAIVNDNLGLSETESNETKFNQALSETLANEETTTGSIAFISNIEETIKGTESIGIITQFLSSVSDALAIIQELWGDWWEELSKHSTSWTQSSKNTTSYTQQTKNTTSWTQETKNKTNTKLG